MKIAFETIDINNEPWPSFGLVSDEPAMTLKQILERKGTAIKTVVPATWVSDVLELLEFDDTGAIIVSRDGKSVEGIISERDIVRGLRYYGPEILNVEVACLMDIGVATCELGDSALGALSIMKNHQALYLPVLDKGTIAGFISLRDLTVSGGYRA